jgi:hypothetical protein
VPYLVALGTASGVSCPSGRNASLVALPYDTTNGETPAPTATPTVSPTPTATPTPAPGVTQSPTPVPTPTPSPPAVFVQNNFVPPPTGADLLTVR